MGGGGVYRWRAYKTRFTVADHSNLLGIVYSLQAMYKERRRGLDKNRLYLLQKCQRSRGKNSKKLFFHSVVLSVSGCRLVRLTVSVVVNNVHSRNEMVFLFKSMQLNIFSCGFISKIENLST